MTSDKLSDLSYCQDTCLATVCVIVVVIISKAYYLLFNALKILQTGQRESTENKAAIGAYLWVKTAAPLNLKHVIEHLVLVQLS